MVLILLIGCSTSPQVKQPEPAAEDETIQIERIVIEGPSRLSVGDTTVLSVIGYDSNQERIQDDKRVNPQWEVNDQETAILKPIDNSNQAQLIGLSSGICYINAIHEEINARTVIEITD